MLLFLSCKKAYNPPAITSPGSYLVVEGVINNSSDSTIIKLNYTVNIADSVTISPVLNAKLAVQDDQNSVFPLTEIANGRYFAVNLNLDNTCTYRLIINTANNKQYYSDYVPVLNAPPIDSVYFTLSNNLVNINTSTHDATNTVKYYRWDYKETWIIQSAYFSYFKSNGDTVLARDFINDNIYQCWASNNSSTLVINSTAKLSQPLLKDNIITSFPQSSEKLAHQYSILVNQYALSADAYNFWTNLKKNTEKLGSIFDAQPSQNNGNMHCKTNPIEPVIGYISVGSVTTKRIFINNQQLPAIASALPYGKCEIDTFLYKYYPPLSSIPINQVNMNINYKRGAVSNTQIPLNSIVQPGGKILGFTGSSRFCVDCTLRGTNKKPDFWK